MENRYHRQIQLPAFGRKRQDDLLKHKVLVIGCGGLGCPVSMYLSRAGVHNLGLVDVDIVDITNLHRQVLFNEADIGLFKVDAAKKALLAGNSQLTIEVFRENINTQNYESIFTEYDIIVDCSDNFETRYLVNDACVLLDKPLIYGAANGLEGQVAVFNFEGSGQLRDLYPDMPNPGTIQNCEEAGVLGVTTGVIGDLMAFEVIKIITGIGKPLVDQLLQFDGSTSRTHFVRYSKSEHPISQSIIPVLQMSWTEYHEKHADSILIDVRTLEEREESTIDSVHIPLNELPKRASELPQNKQCIFFCKTGQRAQQAARILAKHVNQPPIAIVDDYKTLTRG